MPEALALLRRLWAHAVWADRRVLDALLDAGVPDEEGARQSALREAWREYAHVLGAEAVWLSRLERRPPDSAVWPESDRDAVIALHAHVVAGYDRYLSALEPSMLSHELEYRTSNGLDFRTTIADILSHVALHGQYHRGKVNVLLRQSGAEAAPADFVSFARGVPAAITPRTGAR